MQSDSKQLLIFLIIIWTIFIIWEFEIQKLTDEIQTYIVRFDLIVLPVLLFVTGYAIHNVLKNEKRKNN